MSNENTQTQINFDSLFANVSFESDDISNQDSLDSLAEQEKNKQDILFNLNNLFESSTFESDSVTIAEVDSLFDDAVFEKDEEIPSLENVGLDGITKDDNFIKNEQSELQKEPGFTKRFVSNFMEGLSPIPIDMTSDYKTPETLGEQVASYGGEILGFGAGLIGTGGIVGGLKIIGTGAKATQALQTASKAYTRVEKLRKQANTAKTASGRNMLLGKANKQEQLIDASLSAAGVIKNNTLLARSENYQKFITRIGADDYGVGKFMSRIKGVKAGSDEMAIRAANALDLGVTNIAASSIMFQKAIPLRDEDGELIIADRITKPVMDGMLLTLGGLPRVLGAGKITNLIDLNKKSGKAIEAPFVFATGVGASQLGLGVQGEGERTLTDNLLDGAIFTAAHYMGVGADNMRIKLAVREGLDGAIDDPKVKKKIMQALSSSKDREGALDKIALYMSTKRPEYLRRRFVNKTSLRDKETASGKSKLLYKTGDDVIQMTGIKETKNGEHVISYTHLGGVLAGKGGSIKGLSRDDALKKFYAKYRSVMPNPKKFSKDYMAKNPNTLKTGLQLQNKNPDAYLEHQTLVDKIRKKESDLGVGKKEAYLLKRNAFKKSNGNTNKMTMEELTTYNEMLSADKKFKDISKATLDNTLPFELPDSYLANKKNFSAIREFAGSYEKNLQSFGVSGIELSRRVVQYADTKNITRGSFDSFIEELQRDFLPLLGRQKSFNSITSLLDDKKLKLIADDVTGAKIKDKKLLKKRVKDFLDNTFVALAREDVKIQTSRKKFSPILNLYDINGNTIKISDKSFDNGDVLKILRRRGKTVINQDGKKIAVNVDKSLEGSAYVENYVPRYMSEKGLKLHGKDKEGFESSLRAAISMANKGADEDEIDRIVGSYIMFADTKKPLGILNTRKVDIPPYMLIEKGSNRLIQLDELPHISKVKKGMSIEDIDGQSKVIGDVVELYEKDFGNIMRSYAKQVSNSMGLFKSFDEKGASSKTAQDLLGKIAKEAGAEQSTYASNTLRLLLEGEELSLGASIADKQTKVVANLYLSGLSAPIKNFLTGNVQNATSYGALKLLKSYGQMMANPKHYRQLTDEVGAISRNVDELSFTFESAPGKAFSLLSAPFRAIERLNRRSSVAIADVAMRDSFEALTNNKGTLLFRNEKAARRALKDGLSLTDENIDYMLDAMKKRKKYGSQAFSLSVENDSKFRELYKTGLYKSQASTQGVTQLPYIPPWMAKGNYKWATLFYRTAYRVTENTYNKALVPFVRDGNPFPLMTYAAGGTLSGKLLYDYYYGHALGKELVDTNFKKVPLQYFDYAVRGEALGFFGNAFDQYGDVFSSYMPVNVDFWSDMVNTGRSVYELQDRRLDVAVDWTKRNVPLYAQVMQAYKNYNNDINVKFDKQDRLQRQFLDAYPQFKNFEERAGLEATLKKGQLDEQPFYFKLLSESLIQADSEENVEKFERDFLKTRAFMETQKENEIARRKQNVYKRDIRNSIHKSIKSSMDARLRPYPESWEKNIRGQRFVDQYMSSLKPERRKEVNELLKLWKDRMTLLDNMKRTHYLDYYTF
tara:strand:- start:4868 stop:9559 length:4692 start_codon:yes stop_codon:yes gene_type:complete